MMLIVLTSCRYKMEYQERMEIVEEKKEEVSKYVLTCFEKLSTNGGSTSWIMDRCERMAKDLFGVKISGFEINDGPFIPCSEAKTKNQKQVCKTKMVIVVPQEKSKR